MRSHRAGFAVAAALVASSVEHRAVAADIRWNTPPDCDPRDRVTAQIEKLLERALSSVDTVDFEATIEKAGAAGWRLVFVGIERERRERRARALTAETCDALAEAGAVAIAMAIRSTEYVPETDAATPAETAAPEPKPREELALPAPEPEPETAPGPSPEEGADPGRLRPIIGAQVALDTGALPGVSPGLGVSLGVAWRSLRGEATFLAFLPRTEETPAGGGGQFALATGAAAACLQPASAAVRPIACAGFEIGQLTGEGVGVTTSRSGSATWTALKIDAGASIGLGRDLAVLARAGIARPFSRPEFVLGAEEVVYQPAALTVRASLGLEYSW